jgi:hypothetical protein
VGRTIHVGLTLIEKYEMERPICGTVILQQLSITIFVKYANKQSGYKHSIHFKPEINKDVTVGGNKSHKVTTNNTSFPSLLSAQMSIILERLFSEQTY